MAFHDDLLDLARELADLHGKTSNQACLRRAVSTAYYALFHLLISEATANWARPELRPVLGRYFDHGAMKTASEARNSEINAAFKKNPPAGAEEEAAIDLWIVANTFIQAQRRRNHADYNLAKEWIREEVDSHIAQVDEAFRAWHRIRDEAAAQSYLISLLGSKERRWTEPKQQGPRPGRKRKQPDVGTPPDAQGG